uniref:Elongation factor-like 1 n=1 Tax=Acrobeloides nanus TaxID=290746 RepID=A0A914CGN0_9BILA
MAYLVDSSVSSIFEQLTPKEVRNVCIIAHVDHGKTSLADCLISGTGLISARFSGKLRFMDSREDEQTRGITMKSSAISLYYNPLMINLIDSPGHVDFSCEVHYALNLADIAILVVDLVEGVCSQTETLLREAIYSHVDIILVLNKFDRLVVELKMTEAEAFRHIRRLIELINSCVAQIIQGYLIEEDWQKFEATESSRHFDPTKGNVLFASAIHGYAFSLEDFVELWAPKMSIDKELLLRNFFADAYLTPNGIKPDAEAKGKRTVFEQLVLQPLWEVHKCGLIEKQLDKLKEFAKKLSIPPLKSRRIDDAFDEFMRLFLPLTRAAVRAIAKCKSPKETCAEDERLSIFVSPNNHRLWEALRLCDPEAEICVAYVAKLLLCDGKKVAMCRILSGRLVNGTLLYIVDSNQDQSSSITINNLYVLMGRELLPIKSASAGSICAFELDDLASIGTTLCSQSLTETLNLKSSLIEPLVRVSIRTEGDSEEWEKLRKSLRQLAMLDSAVRVFELENGELALVTSGEVHLQKCIQDLNDMGQTNISVSEPMVPFLETIIPDSQCSYAKILTEQLTECNLKNYGISFKLRSISLPDEIVKFLQQNDHILKRTREGIIEQGEHEEFRTSLLKICCETLPKLKGSWWYRKSEQELSSLIERIWSFGPFRAKYNILFNAIPDYDRPSIWRNSNSKLRQLDRAVISGFDLAMSQGPLCDEPMQGVGILVEQWQIGEGLDDPEAAAQRLQDPQIYGQMISAVKQACKVALKKHPLRLVAAMHKCKIQSNSQALGKVHSVLAQRHAKVINEDTNETTGLFEIFAYMPIVESFSFCEQLRKRTSGMASAQMEFSHWQLIEEDPFWKPTTEEEIEEYGEKGDSINQALMYMNSVRKRKGIPTDEVIVVSAEKQRNLKRNK